MSRRDCEPGVTPRRLGKRNSAAEVATGSTSTSKSRKSAGESSAHSQQQLAKRAGKKDRKKQPPEVRLLNSGERDLLV